MSRAYFFGNMYLSSIQQGIQAGHVIAEMFTTYEKIDLYDYGVSTGENPPEHLVTSNKKANTLYDWASNHKTMILLNGGYGSNLHDLVDFFDDSNNPYPWSYFKESEAALDNAITSVGIVLPEKIYEGAAKLRAGIPDDELEQWKENNTLFFKNVRTNDWDTEKYTDWEVNMMERLNCFRLAN